MFKTYRLTYISPLLNDAFPLPVLKSHLNYTKTMKT